MQKLRQFNEVQIDPNRVKEYLLQFKISRKIFGNGYLSLLGQSYNVGTKYAHQKVIVRLNPQSNEWMVLAHNGLKIAQLKGPNLTVEAIQNLTVFQRT